MATALFMAAALAMAQAQAAPPMPPWGAQASAEAPGAQPATPSSATQAAQPVPPDPVVSTAPQDELDSPPTVRPFEMPAAALPASARYAAGDAPEKAPLQTPVKVEAYHRSYEGPRGSEEASYDAGVTRAYQAEQALRGRLEGMWIVSAAADGAPLLSLVISDPGRPNAPPGGAWRDLSRDQAPDASGLIDQVVEEGPEVILQIRLRPGAAPTTLRLILSADGRWRGLMQGGGASKPVVMDRKAI